MRGVANILAAMMLLGALAGCLGGNDSVNGEEVAAGTCLDIYRWNATSGECEPLPEEPAPIVEPEPYRPPHFPNDGASSIEDLLVASIGGHMVPVTIHKPAAASAETPFPVLLHSHGFTGSRTGGQDAFKAYIEAGFAVVSFDQRGHGDATDSSEVNFMQPDIEVADAMAVIDHIAGLDWVLKEPDDPTDPVIGGIGYSYAGAMQLMTAAFDDRLDALVPEMTWNNITTALAPNGAIKSGWVGLFYLAGNTISPITFSQDFHAGWVWAMATNELPAGQAPGVPDLVTEFNEASLDSYPEAVNIPTLLIQGMPDTLFPLNQAAWNHDQINATGAPVHLYTYNGGHTLHSDNLYGESPIGQGAGLQGAPGGWPCGGREELGILWHQKWLLDLDVDLGPKVCVALEDGSTVEGDDWPLPQTVWETVDVGGPWPLAQAVGGAPVPIATLEFDADTVVAGIPRLSGSITSPGADTIVYFSFQKLNADGLLEHIVNDQVRPLRIKGPNTGAVDFEIELGGIGTTVAPGEQMFLVASSIEPMFFGNSERLPAAAVLDGLSLELPVIATNA